MRFPQIHLWHSDDTKQVIGLYTYEMCMCGARRTTRKYVSNATPIDDWPHCVGWRGKPKLRSTWKRGTWNTTEYPELRPEEWN